MGRGVSLRIIFKVENFLKIEKAEIDITNFCVFIGNNNSGKTKLMELIYGVLSYLSKKRLQVDFQFEDNKILFDEEKIEKLVNFMNEVLENEKNEILQSIFNKEMSVGSMQFVITDLDKCYEAIIITEENTGYLREEKLNLDNIFKDLNKVLEEMTLIVINRLKEKNLSERLGVLGYVNNSGMPDMRAIKSGINEVIINELLGMNTAVRRSQLFFPASRMGLAMLYKEYFNSVGSGGKIWVDGEKAIENDTYQQSNHVTKPVLDFLRFLQGYSYNVSRAKKNADLIEFVNEHLLEGVLDENGEIAAYTPKGSDIKVPLYLSSSMINELDPIMKMLTDRDQTTMLYYDEIETSLHPLKQLEMVKLLNRLNNNGMRIIVATHSDTFVTKLNNLLLLARSGKVGEEPVYLRDGKIEISKDDLLKTDDIHIYQFINKSNGRSEVKELEFRTAPMTGYSFELFEDSSTSLFEETKLALGIE